LGAPGTATGIDPLDFWTWLAKAAAPRLFLKRPQSGVGGGVHDRSASFARRVWAPPPPLLWHECAPRTRRCASKRKLFGGARGLKTEKKCLKSAEKRFRSDLGGARARPTAGEYLSREKTGGARGCRATRGKCSCSFYGGAERLGAGSKLACLSHRVFGKE